MRIVMIGAGYVGLTTGACLAELGHDVTCQDLDEARIAQLRAGKCPIFEPGLDDLIARNSACGRLNFTSDPGEHLAEADIVFIAVGTPTLASGDIDLSYIEAAGRAIAPVIKSGAVIVVKSTVVAGTCRWLREVVAEARGGLDFALASNPEFLREGSAVNDFLDPDRVVLGTDDPRTCSVLLELYQPLAERGVPVLCTTTTNAELIKYASNAMLALRIGFINDVADLCEEVAGDVEVVARGVGLDKRIGPAFLKAGPGFGGSCFPKDTKAFAAIGRAHGRPQTLIEALITKNEARKRRLAQRVLDEIGARARGKRVAVLGLTFKAGTNDMRESPSLSIIPALQEAGVKVTAFDPKAGLEAQRLLPGVTLCDDPYEAAEDADAVLVLTDWSEIRSLDLDRLAQVMSGRLLADYRNLFSAEAVLSAGLRHISIGRPALASEPAPDTSRVPVRAGAERSAASSS